MPRAYHRGRYHGEEPQWRSNFRASGKYVGVELEISHNDGYERLLELLPLPQGRARRPIVEEDGSLDEDYAAEIVFPPYTYAQMRDPNSFFARSVGALKQGGALRGEDCGMHMNVNTRCWSEDKKGAFSALINVLPAEWLKNLGGREAGEFCQRVHFNTLHAYSQLRDHALADVHHNRIECRFPAATVEHDDVATLVDFFDYVEQAVDNEEFRQKLVDLIDTHGMEPESFWDRNWILDDYERDPTEPAFTGYDEAAELFEDFLDSCRQTERLIKMKEKMQRANRKRSRKTARAA